MYVPNYMPEPIEVPGNVTSERYPVRLTFIRRVVRLHILSLAIAAAIACMPLPAARIGPTSAALAVLLLLLDVVRIVSRGKPEEPRVSSALFPLVIALVAALCREFAIAGYPIWAVAVGPCCAAVYSIACGKDFSFVGCYLLSLIGSSLIVASLVRYLSLGTSMAALAIAGNTAYLFYWVYDLSSLMARRRAGEEMAAAVDLYRDVFNIFGYISRVIAHWKKHRIWG